MTAKVENKWFLKPQTINLKPFMEGEQDERKEKRTTVSCSVKYKKQTIILPLTYTLLD